MRPNGTLLRAHLIVLLLIALVIPVATPGVVAAASADHLVTHIALAPLTPTVLQVHESVTVGFSYTTTEAGGVRIFARPFTAGSPTPGYSASPSPLYPVGTGTGSGDFTITVGDVVVDQIRLQMWDDGQTAMLFEAFVPVDYRFTNASRNVVRHLGLSATPNVLKRGQKVWVSFDYRTSSAAGVRIFVRPLTRGALTPGYAAHPSPLYPVGSGAGRGWFTVMSGTPTVTGVRIQMWNATQTRLLFQAVVPVTYQFRRPTNVVYGVKIVPATPNVLAFGEDVTLKFGYSTDAASGVRIFTRPMTGGVLSPAYSGNPSPSYPVGDGTAEGYFSISDGAVTVDHVRIQMWNNDQTTLLFQAILPVSYQFR